MLHKRGKPKRREDAVPRIFDGCPSYLSTPKPRSQSVRERAEGNGSVERKRASENSFLCTDDVQADVGTDQSCQTDAEICTIAELERLKTKLWTTQKVRALQRKLAEQKKACISQHASHDKVAAMEKLPPRQKLILDQSLKKACAKSSSAMRYRTECVYDSLLLKTVNSRVRLPAEE